MVQYTCTAWKQLGLLLPAAATDLSDQQPGADGGSEKPSNAASVLAVLEAGFLSMQLLPSQ